METLSDLQKLQHFKEEIRTEFNLLTMRSNMLVTCQSFLVVPFALLQNAASYPVVAVYAYLIVALGIFSSAILIKPLQAAHLTIDRWLVKQRALLKDSEVLRPLALDRDLIPDVERDPSKDRLHSQSLAFSVYGPWSFVVFWILMCSWSTIRLVLKL
ncbi:MAG: hypothetical protein WCQ50_17165 [Spirochaetota bacterium]